MVILIMKHYEFDQWEMLPMHLDESVWPWLWSSKARKLMLELHVSVYCSCLFFFWQFICVIMLTVTVLTKSLLKQHIHTLLCKLAPELNLEVMDINRLCFAVVSSRGTTRIWHDILACVQFKNEKVYRTMWSLHEKIFLIALQQVLFF